MSYHFNPFIFTEFSSCQVNSIWWVIVCAFNFDWLALCSILAVVVSVYCNGFILIQCCLKDGSRWHYLHVKPQHLMTSFSPQRPKIIYNKHLLLGIDCIYLFAVIFLFSYIFGHFRGHQGFCFCLYQYLCSLLHSPFPNVGFFADIITNYCILHFWFVCSWDLYISCLQIPRTGILIQSDILMKVFFDLFDFFNSFLILFSKPISCSCSFSVVLWCH